MSCVGAAASTTNGPPAGVRWAALAGPPLGLAVAGLTHPTELTTATSHHWTVMHVVLVPVFPLLGVAVWVLLAGLGGPLAWVARAAAFVYATFYGALDTVNGVAAGVLVLRTPVGDQPRPTDVLRPLLTLGNTLGWIGSTAFLVAVLSTVALLVRRHGRRTWPGAGLALVAAVSFLDSHIYWPRGVLTMLVLGAGLVLLERGRRSPALVPTGRLTAQPASRRSSRSS